MSQIIYGASDVADLLGISKAAVSNHMARHQTPAAVFMTTDGRLYWDRDGLTEWEKWHATRKKKNSVS